MQNHTEDPYEDPWSTREDEDENIGSRRSYEAALVLRMSVNNPSTRRLMHGVLERGGLRCRDKALPSSCLHTFLDYVFANMIITSCGVHRIGQVIDIKSWIVGETQRLVECGQRQVEWVVNEVLGKRHTVTKTSWGKDDMLDDVRDDLVRVVQVAEKRAFENVRHRQDAQEANRFDPLMFSNRYSGAAFTFFDPLMSTEGRAESKPTIQCMQFSMGGIFRSFHSSTSKWTSLS